MCNIFDNQSFTWQTIFNVSEEIEQPDKARENIKLGKCRALYGPMFSSKTTELISISDQASIEKINHLVISNIKDKNRSKERILKTDQEFVDYQMNEDETYCMGYITTFDGKIKRSVLVNDLSLFNIDQIKQNFSLVIVDEGHLYKQHTLRPFVIKLIKNGVNVVVSGLLLSSDLEIFEDMSFVVNFSDEKTEKKAICQQCQCMNATLNHKKTHNDDKIQVGGNETYISVCRQCYFDLN